MQLEKTSDDDELEVPAAASAAEPVGLFPRTVVDYGIDSPSTVVRLGALATGAGVVMLFSAIASAPSWLSLGAFGACIVLALAALALVWSSRVSKLRERIRCVDQLDLDEDSYVLDAGCGTGAVLVEAAYRTPEGLAVGIDVWQPVGGAVVVPETPLANARLDGVEDHVAVATGDVCRLPFPDEMFDAVTSSLVLGRLEHADARLDAARELARVLVPGGRLVVLDRRRTRALMEALRSVELVDVARSRRVWRLVLPARYVIASKPSS